MRARFYELYKNFTKTIPQGHVMNVEADEVRSVLGTKLNQQMRVEKKINEQGQHGTIYSTDNPHFLVKMLNNSSFLEVDVQCMLKSIYKFPFIPNIYEVYTTNNRGMMILMENIIGGNSVFNFVLQNPTESDHIISQSLEYLYKINDHDIIHGDAHMNNVLIDTSGSISIIDFGLSIIVDPILNLDELYSTYMPKFIQNFHLLEMKSNGYYQYTTDNITTHRQTFKIKKEYVENIPLLIQTAKIGLDPFIFIIPTIPGLISNPFPYSRYFDVLLNLQQKIGFRTEENLETEEVFQDFIELLCFVKYFHQMFMLKLNHDLYPGDAPPIPILSEEVDIIPIDEDINYKEIDTNLGLTRLEQADRRSVMYHDPLPCLPKANQGPIDYQNQTPKELFLLQLKRYMDLDYHFLYELIGKTKKGEDFCGILSKLNKDFIHYKNSVLLLMGVLTTKINAETRKIEFDEEMFQQILKKEEENNITPTPKASVYRYHNLYKKLLQ